MRLDKILNAVIPGMYDTPCKIAIFTNGRKIKVFEKTCFRSLDFNTPVPQNWVRNYNLEKFKSPRAVEALLRKDGLPAWDALPESPKIADRGHNW